MKGTITRDCSEICKTNAASYMIGGRAAEIINSAM
jgi:hypothetical protein